MKKICMILMSAAIIATPLSAFDEDCCELPSPMPPAENCSDYEEQAIGMSMMGWGLAMIAAIAIVAGTVTQSTSTSSSSSSSN
ncbi:MAG: hypothetical protein KDK50_03195 [Chlamydiia bacterium]|nr:hypothetical protein [Chlamydiia bacterium]